MKLIVIGFFLNVSETQCETGMCFACRDSSSNKGKNDCQANTKRMEELHTKLFHEYGNNTDVFMKDFKDDPYVQNCSALANHSYCCIEEFEGGGMWLNYSWLLSIYKKKMWYDCQWDNFPQETKMTQKLTILGHRTAFNNEQSPYRIVSYKRQITNVVLIFFLNIAYTLIRW